ncbi:MAG TPA: hypothetical protein DCY97_22360 [Marinilabiliales bacterium]|nr:hypothetical protein [Marinilabiliales bacterium]
MKHKMGESEEQLNLYQLLFDKSVVPMGIIREVTANNTKSFQVIQANASFMALLGPGPANLPMDVTGAFRFLKGFSNFGFYQVLSQTHPKIKVGVFKSETGFFKITFMQLTTNSLSFSFENITNIQKKKIELAEKKRQLKESEELAQLGYWIESHKDGRHFWSQQVYQILGIQEKDSNPSFAKFVEFVFPDDVALVNELFYESIKTKTGFSSNYRLLLSDGQIKKVDLRCYTNFNSKGEPAQTIGILQDITAIENTKEKLRKSETIFRSVFENAPIAIVLINQDFRPTYTNQQFSDITGYSLDEILARGVKDFTYPDDFENNDKLYTRLFNNEIPSFSITKRYLKKDGTLIWVKVVVSGIKDVSGKTTLAIAMVQDISAEKKASEALLKSEYRYRTLIDNANDGIGLFDMEYKPIIYNSALYSMLGYGPDEYFKQDRLHFGSFHPQDIPLGEKAEESIRQNKKIKIEARLKTKDGTYKYFSISYIPVVHEESPAILIFRRDISKRKEAEAQNEEYRLFLETIMDNLPVSFFAKSTPDFRYIYWNAASEQVTGISTEDALGKNDSELQQSKQLAEQYYQEDQKLLKTKRKLEHEHEYTNSLGEVKHFKTIKTLHESPTGKPIILGLSMDITKLKEAEKQVEQSTQMLKEAQKIAQLGYWEYDVKKDLFFDNAENRAILGITNLPYFLNSKQFKDLLIEADQEIVIHAFFKCIANNTPGNGIIRILVNDEIKHIAINYRPIANAAGEVIKLRGTCLDITRIRQSELALRESEKRLKQAEHIAKVGYWDHNYLKKGTYFSDEVWNILEMPSRHEVINFNDFMDSIHPDDKLAVAAQFYKSNQNNLPFDFDFRIITRGQNVKYIKAIGTFVKNTQGFLERSIGTFQDVTDLRKKELELLKMTEHLLDVQKLSKTGYIEIALGSGIVSFSESMSEIIDGAIDKCISLDDYQKLIHPSDRETIEITIRQTLTKKCSHNILYRLSLPSGKIKYVNEICRIIKTSASSEEFATRIIQDITDIKEKENELTHLVEIKKSNQVGVWEFDPAEKKYIMSEEILTILGLPSQHREISFRNWVEHIHPEDQFSVEKILNASFADATNFTLSYRIIDAMTQSVKHIQDSSLFHSTSQGTVNMIGTIRDITQSRETEQRLLEHIEIFRAITENSLFGTLIIQNNHHIYVNNKWAEWVGMQPNEIIGKKSFNEIFQPETTRVILELLILWSKYEMKEYQNEINLKPRNAPGFYVEVFVKEIIYNNSLAFLILANRRN